MAGLAYSKATEATDEPQVQTTIAQSTVFEGTGLHSGAKVRAVVCPAAANSGIVFCRTDITDRNPMIPARWDHVLQQPLNTRIENADGVHVATIEHLMAALVGSGINNALVQIDAPEVPIMDGSAAGFVRGLLATGLTQLDAPLRAIEILQTVTVQEGAAIAELRPAGELTIDFSIEFADAAIGRQSKSLRMANGAFVRELCDSRTFCRSADIDAMHAAGLALGGSLENAVVVNGDKILSPGGLRHADEAVRHKMLDAMGDLATAGAPILGEYHGVRAGHALTNRLLRALFATPDAWRWVTVDAEIAARLPGTGLEHTDLAHINALP